MIIHMVNGGAMMVRKLVTIVLIGGVLGLAACNTVRGAAADVNSAANCTQNAINTGRCK
jgi:predicted small secreted protein